MGKEEWREVKIGIGGKVAVRFTATFMASNLGRIRGKHADGSLADLPIKSWGRFARVTFLGRGFQAGRIVYAAWAGPLAAAQVVAYRDGDGMNLKPENLEAKDRSCKGMARYSEETRAEILRRADAGESQISIARALGVSQSGVGRILRRGGRKVAGKDHREFLIGVASGLRELAKSIDGFLDSR